MVVSLVTTLVACSNQEISKNTEKVSVTKPICGIDCVMTQESGVMGVLLPSDSSSTFTSFGSIKYTSEDLQGSEVSRFYLDSLSEAGWIFQPEQSEVGKESNMRSLVFCRTHPLIMNLLISMNSTNNDFNIPGIEVLIMTDNYDDLPCR